MALSWRFLAKNVTFLLFWAGLTMYMNHLSVLGAVFSKLDVLSTSDSAFLACFCDFSKIWGQKKFYEKFLKIFKNKFFFLAKIFFWSKSVGNDPGTLDLCQKSFFEKKIFFGPKSAVLFRGAVLFRDTVFHRDAVVLTDNFSWDTLQVSIGYRSKGCITKKCFFTKSFVTRILCIVEHF